MIRVFYQEGTSMKKIVITVTITREIEIDPEFYDSNATDEQILQEEIQYAENLFHEWTEADNVQWKTEGKLVGE
jgi:hypothetical protein